MNKSNDYQDSVNDPRVWIVDADNRNAFEISQDLKPYVEGQDISIFNRLQDMMSSLRKEGLPDLLISEYEVGQSNILEEMILSGEPRLFEKIPTIIISKMSCLDTIRGLFKMGLRDYFVRPLNPVEFSVKVEKILIDKVTPNFSMDHYVRLDDIVLSDLTRKETQILKFLQMKKSSSASRVEIERYCWPERVVGKQALNVHMHNLRKKLKKHGYYIYGRVDGGWKLECFRKTKYGSEATS